MIDSRKTTVIRLCGGLGNQIFQLGAALLLTSKGSNGLIILDDYALSTYKVCREFELSKFIDLSKSDIQVILKRLVITRLRIPKIFSFRYPVSLFVNDNNFQSNIDSNGSRYRLLDGYFQTLRQQDFEDISALLKPLLLDKFLKLNQSESDTCVVHIRGGDFVKLGWNKSTPKIYYISAMNMMRDKYDVNNFVIVTDDEPYARTIISCKSADIKIISSDIVDDFQTIASYSKRILSASTFALWASALGRNEADGVVIAPDDLIPGTKRTFLLQNEISQSKNHF
jgi:hypothetical protein